MRGADEARRVVVEVGYADVEGSFRRVAGSSQILSSQHEGVVAVFAPD